MAASAALHCKSIAPSSEHAQLQQPRRVAAAATEAPSATTAAPAPPSTEAAANTAEQVCDKTWSDVLRQAQPHALRSPPAQAAATSQEASEMERMWRLPPHDWKPHPTLLSGCEPDSAPLRVAVLLSGGVDSSLALRLAQAAGHHVTAFYLQIWFVEDFRNTWDACPWEADLAFCTEVCQQAGVPLEAVPLSQQYWDRVVTHSIAEIRAGHTPNPDVMCNARVKFGAFFEYLEKAHPGRFDRIASGHYAAVAHGPQGAVLSAAADPVKDQTYFLAHLSQAQLARCMFPLAPLTKAAVRQLAAAAALPTQSRPDSQGICFLGKVRHSEFVKEHLGEWPGPLMDADTNEVLGFHSGYWFHTIGQRKGVPLHTGPWYVVRKNIDYNAVYISRTYEDPHKMRNGFRCGPFNWLAGAAPSDPAPRLRRCKVRHGEEMYDCNVTLLDASGDPVQSPSGPDRGNHSSPMSAMETGLPPSDSCLSGTHEDGGSSASGGEEPLHMQPVGWDGSGEQSAMVALSGRDQGMAPGQYAVFYDGTTCIASAMILEPLDLHPSACPATSPELSSAPAA